MSKRSNSLRTGLFVAVAAATAVTSSGAFADDDPSVQSSEPAVEQAVEPIDEALAIQVALEHVALELVTSGPDGRTDSFVPESNGSFSELADSPASGGPEVDVSAVVATEHNATTNVFLQQQIDGIDVRGALSTVTVGPAGDVLAASDTFHTASIGGETGPVEPVLDVVAAAGAAAAALALVPSSAFVIIQAADDEARSHELSASGISRSTIPARLIHEPVDEKSTRLAWEFLIDSTASNDWWRIRIDAETGEELSRFNLVVHEHDSPVAHADADLDESSSAGFTAATGSSFSAGGSSNAIDDGSSYRVFAGPAESPNHTTPVDTRTLVSNPADADASPFGWHDTDGVAGADTDNTSGNNVDAGADRNGDDVLDAASQPENGGLDFDYPFGSDAGPEDYLPAVVTNLFYWNNTTHDFLYAYGFDEAAGNFQVNNYGNGGLGGDPVIAEAQDGAAASPRSLNNANFATPPDGSSPRMQMYVFCPPYGGTSCSGPERSSSMDAGVITHEYAHGLSTRLTGGPAYDECLDNAEQQGEGWSDIIALLMTMQGDAESDRTRGIGTYVYGQPTTGLGIRGQRYAPGGPGGNNTWTYDSIKSGPFSVHAIGAVWAEMLWEMVWAMVDEYGFDSDLAHGTGGNNLATQLIIDGLKLQPCSPGFVDSRDAILQADAINNGGENTCLIWNAFAIRGLGVGASQGSSDNRLDGIEDYSVPASCELSFAVAAPAEVGPGDTLTYTLTASNGTGANVTGVTMSAPVPAETTYVAGSASCSGSMAGGTVTMTPGAVANGASKSCTFAVTTDPDSYGAREVDESFVNGTSNWRTLHGPSVFSNDWELFTYSTGDRSVSADATDGVSDQYLEYAAPIRVQSSATMTMRHGYVLESAAGFTGYDGGVVEASTDGGSTWVDLGPMMTSNGYDRTIDTGFGSPIAGRPAFSGDSDGLFTTEIDLASFAGDDLLIRLRLASDATESANGVWVVTSIEVTNGEVRVDLSASLTSSANDADATASTRVSDEPPPPDQSDVITPITPVRLLDTRSTGETIDGQAQRGGKRSAGSMLTLSVAGRSSIPADATGVVVNVTAIAPEGTGFFTVHPCLSSTPLASSLNYTSGVNLGNEIVAQLDGSGDLCIYTSAATHIAADVVGYLPASSAYGAVSPTRLLDTRDSGGLDAGESISLQVGGRAGVPDGARAAIVNVTAIRPASNGYVTAHACLTPAPVSSSLNYTAGYTRGNEIVVELDRTGSMCLFTSSTTNLSVDVVGYLPMGTTINSATPGRLLDTRVSGSTVDGVSAQIGTRSAGQTTEVVVGGRGGVPADATAALINITAVRPSGNGYVTVSPCGVSQPNSSSLNFVAGTNGGNDLIIGLGEDGKICVYNSTETELTIDITGYTL